MLNPPNRRGTDPCARWWYEGASRGAPPSRLTRVQPWTNRKNEPEVVALERVGTNPHVKRVVVFRNRIVVCFTEDIPIYEGTVDKSAISATHIDY